jgi:hypothetical protein
MFLLNFITKIGKIKTARNALKSKYLFIFLQFRPRRISAGDNYPKQRKYPSIDSGEWRAKKPWRRF